MSWPWRSTSSEAGPSTSTVNSSSIDETSKKSGIDRWERTMRDEEKYQELVYPEFKHVPTCMTLMDEFFMCYALGPQLRNLYRHGEKKDCTWKWNDFKYCLSLKTEDETARRDLWVKRRAEWWTKRRVGQSSEDIWDVRKTPLQNFPPLYREEPPVGSPL